MEKVNFELTREFLEKIQSAIEQGDETFLVETFADLHAYDIAEIFEEVELEEAQTLYKYLEGEKASDVLIELEEDLRDKFLEGLSSKQIAEQFIENLESDDAADVLSSLSEEKKEEVIAQLDDQEFAGNIVDLLKFEEGTAGALMGKELIQVKEDWTVVKCVKEMRKQAEHLDNVYAVYVINKQSKLLGTLHLKKLLTTSAKSKISDIYNPDVHYVKTSTDSEEVASIMERYDLVVLPVVDELHRLVGRITIDDVVDVIKEEAERDYNLASGISESVESTDSVLTLTRARLPWLLIGLVGGILGARVIGLFEGDIAEIPAMAYFIPLIAAMAGNVGVQSSAIIVQGLANDSLGLGGIAQKLSKEFSVALLNGIVLSIIILGISALFYDDMLLSYTVSLALLSVIIFAGIFGTLIPLLLDRYNIDPALATGPFITTLNDIVGLFIYFFIGRLMYM